jgi:outer membrane receptor protein involved in Fe transport
MFRFPCRLALALTPAAGWLAATVAVAQVSDQSGPTTTVVVTAQHLNEERSRIETQTGASTYTLDEAAIDAIPGADNNLLNQLVLRAPGAAQDSFGQFHIRGDHNGLQYRLNGIILPEGLSVFGQTLDPRLVSSMKIVMGSLPAEYGLRTAGIIDLTTKSGALDPGGAVSLYGGSHAWVGPSASYGGTSGSVTYFGSAGYLQNDIGIESPDGSTDPLHDHTKQAHAFGYLEKILDEENRLSFIAGTSIEHFEIPNLRGVHSADVGPPGIVVNGQSDFLSDELDENQKEVTHYGVVSLQHSAGALSVQTSFIARYSSLDFSPDPALGDLFFDGISQQASKRDLAFGVQSDAAYKASDMHTLRAGLYVQRDDLTSNATAQVLATDPAGMPLPDPPLSIVDNGAKTQWIYSLYLQDEWKIAPRLTLNYGLRFDRFDAFVSESQVSPRVNFVWAATETTTVHAGYSRYFAPPPFELVGGETVAKFANTTAAPAVTTDDPVRAERSNYYDLGVEQSVTRELTLGIDSYYKQSTDLIDEGQFGAPIILTPFNYAHGQTYGVEFTGAYGGRGPFSAYANLALQRAIGKDIVSSQFNFDAAELAYIAGHYIHLDHEQQVTGSAGASYLWLGTRFSADILLGSGLRADLVLPDGSSIPNGTHLPYYEQVNLGIVHDFERQGLTGLSARADVINLLDQKYEIRNGTGVGVGAPQYGPRRGYFLGFTQTF